MNDKNYWVVYLPTYLHAYVGRYKTSRDVQRSRKRKLSVGKKEERERVSEGTVLEMETNLNHRERDRKKETLKK